MVMLNDGIHVFWFRQEVPFLGKFGEKKNCQFSLKFGTKNNSNMQNSMAMFTFSVFDQNYSFLANLVHKIKIFSLSWTLLARLIPVCKIQWWPFSFLTGNTLFEQILFKKSKL